MSEEFNNNEFIYEAQYIPTPPKKRGIGAGKIIALALCFSLVGGVLGAGGTFIAMRLAENVVPQVIGATDPTTTVILEGERSTVEIGSQTVQTGKEMTAAQVYATNVGSTVGITTSVTTNYWGYQTTSAASGSGFVLTKDGYILTNHHVIEDSNSVTVTMFDGTTYDAQVVGYDASNDIAVLKIEAEGLTPVVIGDSEKMHVGDPVVAIGNPLGELTFSLTKGVISAMDRQVTFSTGATMNLIQTDCSINSGNSGGALFNLYGEVIGITNAKYSNNGSSSEASIESIGFAIPVNAVMDIVESIIEKGYISKPYIGVSVTDVSEETQAYGLPKGAAVRAVEDGSPSQKAGLQVNDIITAAGGQPITGSSDLIATVSKMEVGQELVLTVYRMGQELTITIVIGEQIQQATEATTEQQQIPQQQQPVFPWGNY